VVVVAAAALRPEVLHAARRDDSARVHDCILRRTGTLTLRRAELGMEPLEGAVGCLGKSKRWGGLSKRLRSELPAVGTE